MSYYNEDLKAKTLSFEICDGALILHIGFSTRTYVTYTRKQEILVSCRNDNGRKSNYICVSRTTKNGNLGISSESLFGNMSRRRDQETSEKLR